MIGDNKFIQMDGDPAEGRQPVKVSEFNDDQRVWSEYQQTDPQAITASVPLQLTCDGVEYNNLTPSGGVVIWNHSTNEGTLVAGGFYFIEFGITATATSNNTVLQLALVDPASPSTIHYSQEFDFARSGTEEIHPYVFSFFSKFTGEFALYALTDKNMTIDDITVVAKREY
jgi:hypothetical protein